MTDKFEERDHAPALEEFRDELGGEFVRVARAESGSRVGKRLRRGGLAILAAAIVVPGAIAAENEFGGSTTRVLQPAPASLGLPAMDSSDNDCPEEARALTFEVLAGEKTLSDYRQSPGYPVKGCATAEELQQFLQDTGSTLGSK